MFRGVICSSPVCQIICDASTVVRHRSVSARPSDDMYTLVFMCDQKPRSGLLGRSLLGFLPVVVWRLKEPVCVHKLSRQSDIVRLREPCRLYRMKERWPF